MPIQFPSNPTINQTYTYNSRTWTWSGTRWIVKFGIGSNPKDITWLTTQTSNFTALAGFGYPVNTTSSAITVTLPASPSAGDLITLTDYAGTFATNNMTVSPNGNKINGSLVPATFATNQSSVQLVYIDATQGWKAYSFSVTSLTQTIPVDYLVVAGGGGGGTSDVSQFQSGGGGAGGLRTGSSVFSPATSITVTIGAGGAGAPASSSTGVSGSNSVFSTITSAGGGGGGSGPTSGSVYNGVAGGSGGGASLKSGSVSGAGNTPATSPSQGNAGANAGANPNYGGGGGGAGAAALVSGVTGTGGSGASSSITGSSVTYAGGGGGGIASSNGGTGGGGAGGGSTAATSGATNLGGGGGGAGIGSGLTSGAAGGSGVVIIAYPNTYPALASIGAGLTYDQPTRSGYRVYRFTQGTGTISW